MTPAETARSVAGESTRERILGAAEAEFALHGIAGARVDRIAKGARTSKERVYAHFRSKEELYAVVSQHQLTLAAEAAPLDARDLPAYAGALFDYFAAHPDRHRFLSWGRLELASGPASDGGDGASGADGSEAASGGGRDPYGAPMTAKVEKLRRAQASGDLDPSWDPVDVFALVGQIAFTGVGQPEVADLARRVATDTSQLARRAAVVRAVSILFPPANHPAPENSAQPVA